ncbi:MAG: CtsR family transcriptional regulator [Ruminococcaceae bacterium]|nr:CtsR family transcriptional regulator [Oscillospiraceae bacterium]
MRISDEIAAYILHRLEQAEDGAAELQRNLLAEELGCVPSQISYVLTSRFTPEQGYIVESRRGGGGYIRVQRIRYNAVQAALMHIVNSVGDTLSAVTANAILANLVDRRIVEEKTARLVGAALSDKAYRNVAVADRDRLRAALLKQMLTTLADS